MMKSLPNALTLSRIALSALVFFALAFAAGALSPSPPVHRALILYATAAVFVVAALTDFFDGWLARRIGAVSVWGAILDPIADKIAIAAAILGLVLLEPSARIAVPGFLILFREMGVSGLREGLAPRGIKLPVTLLAKWKTTVQLAALTLEMVRMAGPPEALLAGVADGALMIAAALTLWTGYEYAAGARRALL